jgi:hypothetical protein
VLTPALYRALQSRVGAGRYTPVPVDAARAIRAVARAAVRPRGQQLDRELTDMLENPKFNFVCTECGSMSIAAPRIPLAQAPETTVIPCGGCGASRGTLATLRELARSGTPQQDDTTAQKAP